MIQDSTLRKRVMSIEVASYSPEDIVGIYVAISHSALLNLSCSNIAMLEHFY